MSNNRLCKCNCRKIFLVAQLFTKKLFEPSKAGSFKSLYVGTEYKKKFILHFRIEKCQSGTVEEWSKLFKKLY